MARLKVLILGGYGNAGMGIARLLSRAGDLQIVLAGRNRQRALAAAGTLNAESGASCFSAVEADASNRESLLKVFRSIDIVVIAASVIDHARTVAETAIEAGIDYFDVQISSPAKLAVLESLRARILESGRCFITDGGYRPGLPAAMVRYAASQIPGLESARVASAFQVDWRQREFSMSSAAEFADELKYFSQLVFKDGYWKPGGLAEYKQVDFGSPFGVKACMPMFLEELRALPDTIPSLKETGFYSAGFGSVMDYVVIPLAFALLKIAPNRSRKPIAWLMNWGLKNTTRPPYGAVLQMTAQGSGHSLRLTVAHDDAYVITAAPVVACLLQYFDGTIHKPGLWSQANLVEPTRFFEDLQRFGVGVSASQ